MDIARRIAAELAILLRCDAWVSMRSWHYPGSTIRITLAKSKMELAPHCEQDLSVGSSVSHKTSNTMALNLKQTRAPVSHHHNDVAQIQANSVSH